MKIRRAYMKILFEAYQGSGFKEQETPSLTLF